MDIDYITGVILAVIACTATIVIIFIATFRTVLDILLSFNFVPHKVHEFFIQFRKREVLQVLDEIGLTAYRSKIRAFSSELSFQKTEFISIDAAYNDIDRYIEKAIEQDEYEFSTEDIKSKYMVNFRKYITTAQAERIAIAFASFIYHICNKENITYDIVVSPATSTLILNYYVSQLLGKPLFAFDLSTKTAKSGKPWVLVGPDTNIGTERNTAIIIDESVVGGRMLNQTWQGLKDIPLINCSHAFTIFHRKEGNINRFPEFSNSVRFHCMRDLSETDIENIIKKT